MCEGSIHVKHRQATDKEHLVVQTIPRHGIKGFYPVKPTAMDKDLVCCRGTIEGVLIKQVHFEKGMPPWTKRYEGKRNVKVMLRHRNYYDEVVFPNGKIVWLANFKDGVRLDIGYPVKKRKPVSKGMQVVKGALREALALPPDPKPEEADAPSSEPPATEPAVNPVKEPAPAGDAPREGATARRRRR